MTDPAILGFDAEIHSVSAWFRSVGQRATTAAALAVLLLLVCLPQAGLAQANAEAAPSLTCPGPSLAPMLDDKPERDSSPLTLKTRSFNANNRDLAEASGQVEVTRADQYLATELLRYNPGTKTVRMPGAVNYRDAVIYIDGVDAEYNFETESGSFATVDYGLTGSSARGRAEEVVIDTGNHSFLRQLQFTTCPGDSPQWLLTANELELNFDKGIGTARGAKLRFSNIPILYLPYMTFPIDDRRKSGFLYPFLSTANDNGLELSIPFYWNIAPNHDATLTPRYFTRRGAMLTAEYRFITRNTGATFMADYMPNDKVTDETRYHYKFNHMARFSERWRSQVVINRISDPQYFQDFGNSLVSTSRQYLKSRAAIEGGGRFWTFSISADDFQIVDESISSINEPYARLPRLLFGMDLPLGHRGLLLQLDSELVYFDREIDIGPNGTRFDVHPRLEWDLSTFWGYVRPTIGYRYTAYDLTWDRSQLPILPDRPTSPDRGTPIVSFDTGIFLDRSRRNGMLQTLEPRLFYLYVPYKNQENLPNFDSAPFTFGFGQLFHFNRFTGADRQSDANQLTLALTTRSISQISGHELWSLSLGQIFFFENQRVMPARGAPLDDSASPFIAEFVYRPNRRLSGRLAAQWDWQNSKIDVAVLGIEHSAVNGRRLGAEYRFRRDSLDQFDLRYYQPVNESWRVLSRVIYSIEDNDLLSAEAGFEYESCCWALRLVAKRYLRNNEGDHRDAVFVQLLLKGLAGIGRRADPFFYDLAD